MPTDSVDPILIGDRDALLAIRDRLQQTGAFARVVVDTPVDDRAAGADALPLARLAPLEWVVSTDPASGTAIHLSTYRLTLIVRDPDGTERLDQLCALAGRVRIALDGSDLGGLCLTTLSLVERGLFETRAVPPEGRLVIHGQYGFMIERPA